MNFRCCFAARGLAPRDLLFLAECHLAEVQKTKDSAASQVFQQQRAEGLAKRPPGRLVLQKKQDAAQSNAGEAFTRRLCSSSDFDGSALLLPREGLPK